MLFAVVLASAVLLLARKPRPPGFFVGFTMLAYAPTRFALDFMRALPTDAKVPEADPRYFTLTPGQWACIAMATGGIYFLWMACRSGSVGYEAFQKASDEIDLSLLRKSRSVSAPPPTATGA